MSHDIKSGMKLIFIGIASALILFPNSLFGNPAATNTTTTNRPLVIERSYTTVSGARATLTIGRLQRALGIYAGDYQMKVAPFFFKSEKGKLAIIVSDESLLKLSKGLAASVTGTATSEGEKGKVRRIDAIATPLDKDHGGLTLWFVANDKKLIFDTRYRFIEP